MARYMEGGEVIEMTEAEEAEFRAMQATIHAESKANATVLRHQAKIALIRAGLMTGAEAAIAEAGPEAAIWWAEAPVFERGHPLINSIGTALGLTETQIDDLFMAAAAV
jgi:hypothetical protein